MEKGVNKNCYVILKVAALNYTRNRCTTTRLKGLARIAEYYNLKYNFTYIYLYIYYTEGTLALYVKYVELDRLETVLEMSFSHYNVYPMTPDQNRTYSIRGQTH